jgi:hypothetical protein
MALTPVTVALIRQRLIGLLQRGILLPKRLDFPRQFTDANGVCQAGANGWRWNVDIFGAAMHEQGVVNFAVHLSNLL